MFYLLRHAAAVLLLPAMVVVVIPAWIARRYDVMIVWPATAAQWLLATAGFVSIAIGLSLFAASVSLFFSEGRGTLAPWDPPRRLVVRGPYRHVRNPMISGVMFLLAGIALALRSRPHGVWAVLFAAINALYIPLLEEPLLAERFGDEYGEYCRQVPRFLPRIRAAARSGAEYR